MNLFFKSRFRKSSRLRARGWLMYLMIFILLGGCTKPLEHFGKLPEFSLINQENQPVTLQSLKGYVWVANFIYTGCGATCPTQTQRMSFLQTLVTSDEVKWVSISVDPEIDTPARLQEYANRYKADPAKWFFLTGDTQTIQDVATQGFKLSMKKEDATTIFHSERFVLVDRMGEIRGYFEFSETGNKSLREAMARLLKEKI